MCHITKGTINPNDFKTFKIVHIYKKDIDDSYKNELKDKYNIVEPEFEDDYENCLMVSSSYEENSYNLFEDDTVAKIVELYKAKEPILLKAKIIAQLNEEELSKKLRECITRISSSSLPKVKNETTILKSGENLNPNLIEPKL